jgi:SAM-dependent methyltransferase
MPGTLARGARRAANAFSRLRSGLPLRGGVSPEVPNDLFQAHLALYLFAAGLAAGKRVLDLGCGTGYGTARLAEAGAAGVLGIDSDPACVAYARRRFARPGVRFAAGDAESLEEPPGAFDLVFAPYLLPRLASPAPALGAVARLLAPEGTFAASVPPIVDEEAMEQHRESGLHPSVLYLWDWESLLRRRFEELRLVRLDPPRGARLDFTDPFPSRLRAEQFLFEEVSLADPRSAGTLSAIFVCRGPRPD